MSAPPTLFERPWDSDPVRIPGDLSPVGNSPRIRETDFGSGQGILTFHVDDDKELIHILDIVWTD